MATISGPNGVSITSYYNTATGLTSFSIEFPNGISISATSNNLKSKLQSVIDSGQYAGTLVDATNLQLVQGVLNSADAIISEAFAESAAPAPPATASQTAQEDGPQGPTKSPTQQVDANGRVITTPTITPTNATPAATAVNNADTGTAAPVRTTEQTQAPTTASNSGQAVPDPSNPGSRRPAPPIKPGTSASDDQKNNSTTTKQAEVNGANNSNVQVTPQPNILDKYASYTYVASVYLLTEAQYKRVVTSKNRKVDGYQLLFQTGGAPVNVGGIKPNNVAADTAADKKQDPGSGAPGPGTGNTPDAGRSPFFDNDFYIDSISLENLMVGKGTGSAHMSATLKFTLCEPMGMTLFDRLYKAVENQQPKDATGKVNYTSAAYLMTIRFYGYDENGNLMAPVRGGIESETGTSDPQAVVEKFIPFNIKSINWTIGNKLTTYEWDCVPVGQLQGGYSGRGTVPYDVQLAAGTVGKLLKGNAQYSATTETTDQRGRQGAATDTRVVGTAPVQESTAPAKANSAPTKKTVTQGLMGALNDFQDELVRQGVYEIPDRYSIEFVDGAEAKGKDIEEAKLQLPNTKVDKKSTPAAAPATKDANNVRPETNQVDMVNRTFSITAGMSILQAIEMSIRNSEYINKQQLIIVNPDGTYEPNPNAQEKNFQWFTISMSATPRPGGIDKKRNDYAYDIKYTVRPYLAKNVISKYFPPTKFSGVHKSYPYWFTGKNTAVLKYEETMNALYQLTVSGDARGSLADKQRDAFTSSMLDMVKYGYAPRSNQSAQGAEGKTFEPSANAAENMYSPGDLANTQLRIVGDPAWIQQGSLYQEIKPGEINVDLLRKGFEPDGSISFDSQDILFEVVWQRPEDYNLNTGLADPYSGGYSGNQNSARSPIQSRVYIATKVVSDFKHGSFEQTVHGSLYLLPKKDATNATNAVPENADASRVSNQSAVETNRLRAAAAAAKTNAVDAKIQQNSVTSSTPTSATARGVQSILQPPPVTSTTTDAQIRQSTEYNRARISGLTDAAAIQLVRNQAAANTGTPVSSNNQSVSTGSRGVGATSAAPQQVSREA